MVNDKSGISAIVATVLIILITVAAVTIIWAAIIPMIQDKLSVQDFDVRLSVETAEGYTVYDADEGKLLVRVGRGSDESVIDKIRIVVNFNGDTYSELVDPPKSNQYRVYAFDISNYVSQYGDPIEIMVAPLILKGGSVKEGVSSSNVEILEGKIVNVGSYAWDPFGKGDCIKDSTRNCGSDTGLCKYGSETCIEFEGITVWEEECSGGTVPVAEICDEQDHDCDGADTNGLTCDCITPEATQGTTCGQGECASTGMETCTDGLWVGDTCTAGNPGTEVCSGLDEDCDGISDNNFNLQSTTCGQGECASTGMETCIGGVSGDNCIAGSPSEEICTGGLDEDCDGLFDDEDVDDCGVCNGAVTYAITGTEVCSDELSSDYSCDQASNGDITDHWFGDITGAPKWVYGDLGSKKCISGVRVNIHGADIPQTMDLQVSDDAVSWTTVESGWTANVGLIWLNKDFTETRGRYVRFYITSCNRQYCNFRDFEIASRSFS